jgi:glycosyltransferase involved in cell wall biosynthesis
MSVAVSGRAVLIRRVGGEAVGGPSTISSTASFEVPGDLQPVGSDAPDVSLSATGPGVRPGHDVLLMTEGTYPLYKGGVSQWCDSLIRGLPGVRFHVVAFVGSTDVSPEYTPPSNVVSLDVVPLWSVRELIELRRDISWRGLRRARRVTSEAVIGRDLVPSFSSFVDGIVHDDGAAQMAPAALTMYRFFGEHDFDTSMRSRALWEAFCGVMSRGLPRLAADRGYPAPELNLADLTTAMMLLYRWMMPLAVPVPDVDVAHATSGGLSVLTAVVAKLDMGAAFLLTEHGIYLRERYLVSFDESPWQKFFSLAFARRITELSYLFADQISPGSKFNERWEVGNGAQPAAVRTIYNGVEPGDFNPVDRPSGQALVVSWVGRITPVKDLVTLLHAAAIVHGRRDEVRFRLYGTAPGGDEVYLAECLAVRDELGLEGCVTFEGYVASVEAAFNEGDIAVICSVTEGFPYSVIEAMLCARPVVGTAVGGIPEALAGGGGITVPPRNPAALAEGLLRVIEMPESERLAMGQAARDRAAGEFSLAQSLEAYEHSYSRLTSQSRRVRERDGRAGDQPGSERGEGASSPRP